MVRVALKNAENEESTQCSQTIPKSPKDKQQTVDGSRELVED